MEFDKDEKYTIGQREFLLLVKSELEDLRKKIGGPITHHDTEDLLIHRIVERVVLWNQSMKTYTKFVVSEPSYKKPTPIESLTIKDIIKKDKKVFEGKKNASTVAKEYPEFESFLELLKKHHAIVGVKAATNRVLFCISWLIETIMKDNHVGKLPPFLEKVIHHASAAPAASSSSSSSSSSAASPSKSSKTSKMPNGPSPKKGVRIQGGSKNRGSKNRGSKNRGSKNRGTRRSRR